MSSSLLLFKKIFIITVLASIINNYKTHTMNLNSNDLVTETKKLLIDFIINYQFAYLRGHFNIIKENCLDPSHKRSNFIEKLENFLRLQDTEIVRGIKQTLQRLKNFQKISSKSKSCKDANLKKEIKNIKTNIRYLLKILLYVITF